MDKIKLLHTRRKQLTDAGKNIREQIDSLVDEDSFVELSAFSFSRNDFYGSDAEGEGVVTGFATVDDYPFYIVAQNFDVMSGGVSLAGCSKMSKCLEQAGKNGTPVIYILSTLGVQVGEGVNVLEGIARLLLEAAKLRNVCPQYLIVDGDVFGQISSLAAVCDFTFFIEGKSVLSASAPSVVSAHDAFNIDKTRVGGADALADTGLVSFKVKGFDEIREDIVKITDILSDPMVDAGDLNASVKFPDTGRITSSDIMKLFDRGSSLEVASSMCPGAKCILGRMGGIALASVVFSGENGCRLTAEIIRKITDFENFAARNSLPVVVFVDTMGLADGMKVQGSLVMKEIGNFLNFMSSSDTVKISVVYGKAIGLGYTLFAAKSMGYDFVCAFPDAKIALFDSAAGADVELAGYADENREALEERYSDENSDPINAARGGYIDNIVEPAFAKQHIIAALQMSMR